MNCSTILFVEDDKTRLLEIKHCLQILGYKVSQIAVFEKHCIKTLPKSYLPVMLINGSLPTQINGLQAVNKIQNNSQIPVSCLTDSSEDTKQDKTRLDNPFTYIAEKQAEEDLDIPMEMVLYKRRIDIERRFQQQQSLMTVIDSMAYAVVVTDTNGHIQMMNSVAERLTGWNEEDAVSKDLVEVLALFDKETGEKLEHLAAEVITTGKTLNLPENCTLTAKNGKEIPIGDSIAPIRDSDGNITGAVLVFQDITKRKQTEAELLRNAFYDSLTGLPNRVLFLDRLRHSIGRRKRQQKLTNSFAVLFLDLDGFKKINDSFGHSVGDKFLIAIARKLESCLREVDTIARFGGDEFAVLLEDVKEISDATNIAERIQKSLAEPLNLDGNQITPSASIGITVSNGEEEPENLLRDADIAMYRAKGQVKGSYMVFG
jgi:diguanylate cyclase (GGDEF)-like protein/PAS domain S-box-containing protein